MRALYLLLGLACATLPAHAAMPTLTALPAARTPDTCLAWATKQDAEAREIWGTRESGNASDEVAVMRLTLSCLGDPAPEIVGFHSSAGAGQAYCRKRPGAPICRDVPTR